MNKITVLLDHGRVADVQSGSTVGSLLSSAADENGIPWLAAVVNNDIVSLTYPITVNSTVRFLTMADSHGWRVYRRSLCFLLAKAVQDMFPDAVFRVEHSFGLGLYCSFSASPDEKSGITTSQLKRIEHHMHDLVARKLPIERRKVAYTDAVREFQESHLDDKLRLLLHRNPPHVVIQWCEGFFDLAHGPLASNTGMLNHFQLIHYTPGFVLHLPDRSDPNNIPPFEDQPHLFRIFQEHKEWGRILRVNTVGCLNEIIERGEMDEFIRINEALHEKKVAAIADSIAATKGKRKIILIAGPSSSGKTTFAKRLAVQLRANGLRPRTLSTDDYFVGPAKNPIGPDGKPDFEHLEAVDLELFNEHLDKLTRGISIEVPRFDFTRKERVYKGEQMSLQEDELLIIEGIHGLNPRLTAMVPAERKYKIYISALTQLSVDANNRISTTDNRLMRRIVRDHTFRGHSALYTLQLWPSVRQGEKTWIFPFQREADATFNSALDYELAVLKPCVEPLLMQVKPDQEEYAEARRLSEFLLNFVAVHPTAVPRTSILREYIGGSAFRY